jgi:two-component system response regulator YesN
LYDYRSELETKRAEENVVREAYIVLMEATNTQFPYAARPRLSLTDKSPYEALLTAETWDDVHQIVFEYVKQCFRFDPAPTEKTYADTAVDMIHRYYAEDISLQSVAGQINVNPSYLSRVFKQERGENFVSYLTRIRIEKAKSLLESRRLRVYEVADRVGYHNYTYFSKIFKKVVGVSPEEFRN